MHDDNERNTRSRRTSGDASSRQPARRASAQPRSRSRAARPYASNPSSPSPAAPQVARNATPQGAPPYRKDMDETITGGIRHASGKELARPVDFPRRLYIVLALFIIAGAAIGYCIFDKYYDTFINSSAKQEALVESYLSRGVSLDLPVLTEYAPMSDEDIHATLQDEGYQIHDVTSESSSLDLIKSPSDISATEAATLYATGIDSLSPSDAARLLCGFWRLDTSRTDGYTIRVRYVDFKSGDANAAISSCLTDEQIDVSSVTDEGVDSSGNTYKTGTVDVDGTSYQWRASAISFDSVYDIGLPESAMYVGFRLTELA